MLALLRGARGFEFLSLREIRDADARVGPSQVVMRLATRMLPLRPLLATLVFAGCASHADPPLDARAAPVEAPDVVEWREDLDALCEGLISKHVAPFTHVTREAFLAEADRLRDEMPNLAPHACVVGLAKVAALIGDGHARVLLEIGKPPCARPLPLRFVWLADGVFVDAAADAHVDLLGARVAAIDGVPIDDVAARVRALTPCETESAARDVLPRYLTYVEVLHAFGVARALDEVELTVVDAAGRRTAIVKSIDAGTSWSRAVAPDPRKIALPVSRIVRSESYWHERLDGGATLYCRYDRCANDPKHSVAQWTAEVRASLESAAVRRVILDVRRNSGGNSSLIWPLAAALKLWRASDRTRAVLVLVGGATYSSAASNALELRDFCGAVLVGEPPGQARAHFGEVRDFRLPHCRLRVTYSTTKHGDPRDRSAIEPDVFVTTSSADYFAGRDPVLDAARAHAPH